MLNKLTGINGQKPLDSSRKTEKKYPNIPRTDRSFQSFVDEALKVNNKEDSIHFSNHAQKRMDQRGIKLDTKDLSKIDSAFTTLAKKGSKNSLIMYDDLSLIASIKNRTIITASKTKEMMEVTNIDSAIHIKK